MNFILCQYLALIALVAISCKVVTRWPGNVGSASEIVDRQS